MNPTKQIRCNTFPAINLVILLTATSLTQVWGEPLSFKWKDGQSGVIRSKISDSGKQSVLQYEINKKDLSTEKFQIAFSNASFETSDGPRPIDIARVLPSIIVNRDGEFERLQGVGDANRRIFERLPIEVNERSRINWEQKMKDPSVIKSMNERVEGMWNTWVGSWNGLDVGKGYGFKSGSTLSLRSGNRVLDYEYLGPQKKVCERCIKLRCTSSLDREHAIATVEEFLRQNTEDLERYVIKEAGSQTEAEVITDTSSLLPYYARSTTFVMMAVEGMGNINRELVQEYWFDWNN